MGPQVQISTYSEQFASPGGGSPARARPSSSTRRNNPHPQPDFLFPRRLQPTNRPSQALPMGVGRPLFPPLGFHSRDARAAHHLNTTVTGKLPCIPAASSSATYEVPSAGKRHKLHPRSTTTIDGQVQTPLRNMQRSSQREPGQRIMNQGRRQPTTKPQRRLHTADQHHPSHADHWTYRSSNTLDSCGGHSCFHVVKPYQAGHYVIHPEFVSESLR